MSLARAWTTAVLHGDLIAGAVGHNVDNMEEAVFTELKGSNLNAAVIANGVRVEHV